MTSDKFLRLQKGDEVEILDDYCVYQVLDTDKRMGRIKMAKIVFKIETSSLDLLGEYDSYDDAMDVVNSYSDLHPSDIEEDVLKEEAFWMDYRDVYMSY